MATRNNEIQCNVFGILLSTFLIFFLIGNSIGQNECTSKEQCGKCIQTKNCAWCTKEDFQNQPRCVRILSQFYNDCTDEFIINPKTVVDIKKPEELTRKKLKNQEIKNDENPKIVQITPQYVSLKLKPNEIYNLKFQYSLAEDAPIDLYYLMDLSRSMLDHKNKLSLLGNKLAEAMKAITRNFRLGFGSFVDKVLMPFTSLMPQKLENPCSVCAPPYSYKHHMNLSTDTNRFEHEVRSANVSGNIDSPEGGLDAIMQAIVCREQIGWRESARRLLVYSTDAGYHYAGDGKLAGLIDPNDGECHMEGNRYTHAEILDYPSVPHINYIVKKNVVNVIFAVTKGVSDTYKELSKSIEGASYGILDQDSSNVVELIKNEYNKITSSVEITDTAKSPISIKYFTSCSNPNGKLEEQNKCSETKHESIINFEAEIKVLECPKDEKDWKQKIRIYPIGVDESIIIDLEILCGCDCEKPDHSSYKTNSEKCNKHGTYSCGLCQCNDKYFGRKCECSSTSKATEVSTNGCRKDNTTKVDCNGVGICRCNVCECNKRENADEIISGPYCECNNFQCPRSQNKQLCSGEDHGTCECGEICKCKPEWSGLDCNCKTSNDTCFQTPDQNVCSGRGKCKCGECSCNKRSTGTFCEVCPTCENRCDKLKYCVECQAYKSGPLAGDECSKNCTLFNTKIVDKIENIENDKEDEIWELCKVDENNCKFSFEYRVFLDDPNKVEVRTEKDQTCERYISTLEIAAYVIFPILAIGILSLLLWKVFTMIHDKREYVKFEREKSLAKWNTDDNPLYKDASSNYQNPEFKN